MKVIYFAIIYHLLLGSFRPLSGSYAPDSVTEIRGIIERAIGSAESERWAELLRRIELRNLPPFVTIFFPTDHVHVSVVLERWAEDRSIIQYHVIPYTLTACELRHRFRRDARIPTLLPGKSLLVTNNTRSNFTMNGVPISRPQMFFNGAVAVHGISTFLDNNTLYGATLPQSSPAALPAPPNSDAQQLSAPGARPPPPNSDAPQLSVGIVIAFLAAFGLFFSL